MSLVSNFEFFDDGQTGCWSGESPPNTAKTTNSLVKTSELTYFQERPTSHLPGFQAKGVLRIHGDRYDADGCGDRGGCGEAEEELAHGVCGGHLGCKSFCGRGER